MYRVYAWNRGEQREYIGQFSTYWQAEVACTNAMLDGFEFTQIER